MTIFEPTPLNRALSVVSRTDELLDLLRRSGFQPEVPGQSSTLSSSPQALIGLAEQVG
jgi:hypothetical protein